MKNPIAIQEIINFLGTEVIQVLGNTDNRYIQYLKPSESVDEFTLDWVNSIKTNKQLIVESSKAKVIIVDSGVEYSSLLEQQGKVLIIVSNPKLVLLKIGNKFFVNNKPAGTHITASIDSMAEIGELAYIGANVSIGACVIGNNVMIYPNVVINDNVQIGNNVIIKAGAIIGFDGFGYERDELNNLIKFPQLGSLIIEDNVEIGSNTCIDKGSLSDTIIGFNTKINNLCHIAHNVVIGKNVVIAAQVNISGSTTIGDDVWIAPNASLRGQQKIGKNTTIGMGAVVTKDVPDGETWFGNPAKKKE